VRNLTRPAGPNPRSNPPDELSTHVREYAAQTGAWPSCRRVMAEFHVGRPKAAAALEALRATGFDPAPEVNPGEGAAVIAHDAPVQPSVQGQVRHGPWPLVLISLGAFVSIWGGWVGLGQLTGFGPIRLLPGIADQIVINSAITLPIGVEAYAAFALRIWLGSSTDLPESARTFAQWSAIGALALGAAGQITYHLMLAAGVTRAPWPITAFVSCLPVVVLGCGAALFHLVRRSRAQEVRQSD
jgi:hypothetical protein